MSSPGVTLNLACGKGVTELQNLTKLHLLTFAESHQMQQKNFDVFPKCPSSWQEITEGPVKSKLNYLCITI